MTNEEKREHVARIVKEFTLEYLNRHLLWQLGQIVPGADNPAPNVGEVLRRLHSEPPAEALRFTLEPQEWLQMALYGAGLVEVDAGEIHEVCQGMAESLFAIPGHNAYQIPSQWAETEMGALWWAALIRAQGDELVTIAEAARIAGVSVQAISQRIDRGTLEAFVDPFSTGERQGRRLVRRSDIVE